MMRGELVPAGTRADPLPSPRLLRRCACGQHAGGGECEECRKAKRQGSLQRSAFTAGGAGTWLQRQPAGPAAAPAPAPAPAPAAAPAGGGQQFEGCAAGENATLQRIVPLAKSAVDRAIAVLSPGWDKMAPTEKALFNQFFDPGGTGDVDKGFVRDVKRNFEMIRAMMPRINITCNRGVWTPWKTYKCEGEYAWSTSFPSNLVVVCDLFLNRAAQREQVITIIHEVAHIALATIDRATEDDPKNFNKLKPRGNKILSFLGNIPVIGLLFRLFNSDTLYNPDSYGAFAAELGTSATGP